MMACRIDERARGGQPTYEVHPGPDGTFEFGRRRGGPPASFDQPAPRDLQKAEAISRLGAEEAETTCRRVLDSPPTKVGKTR